MGEIDTVTPPLRLRGLRGDIYYGVLDFSMGRKTCRNANAVVRFYDDNDMGVNNLAKLRKFLKKFRYLCLT